MVICGATGDLTRRKLIPALYNLARAKHLSPNFAIVGMAREEYTTEVYRELLTKDIATFLGEPVDAALWDWFLKRIYYTYGDFRDPACYQQLKGLIAEADKAHHTQGNHFFYLAVAPAFFSEIVRQLGAAGLTQETGGHWRRVIVEKPFGRDLESARTLNIELKQVLTERQIYRIDHYLGKETVQNIMVLRFANGIFEPVWNRRYIDHVQITVTETLGVEMRGPYYEQAGALRDMVPNHLFQILTLVAMEPPSSLEASALHNEQVKVLEAIEPITLDQCRSTTVRAQYESGTVGSGSVLGYRQESKVNPASRVETYAAFKLAVDNWRWAGVPFYLRTGKRLTKKKSEVVIYFKQPPLALFRAASMAAPESNQLVISIQPEEMIKLRLSAKVPGPAVTTAPVDMRFNYEDYFGVERQTGYETLLYDAMMGDHSLFKRADIIETGWAIVDQILQGWSTGQCPLGRYDAGTAGPPEADALLARDGRQWRPL
jgi:glucose-6-phosphate 1-dehydrogenase